MMGFTSSDGTTIEDIQVQSSEGKKIHLEKLDETRCSTPLSSIKIPNQEYQNPSPFEEYDSYPSPVWAINTPNSHDILDQTFLSDEAMMEVMSIS